MIGLNSSAQPDDKSLLYIIISVGCIGLAGIVAFIVIFLYKCYKKDKPSSNTVLPIIQN